MKRKYWIISIILLLLMLVGGILVFSEVQRTNNIRKSIENLDASTMNYIKAALNYYYVLHGEYPRNTEELVEKLPDEQREHWQKTIKNLKEFTYSVRGDKQAYKATYTNYYGEKIEIQGNYQEDFH